MSIISSHGEEHVAMVVGLVAFNFACVLVAVFCVCELWSGRALLVVYCVSCVCGYCCVVVC